MTDKVSIYLLIYFKVLFMFTHAIQNNDIITFINNLNKVTLTNVTVWNYTIVTTTPMNFQDRLFTHRDEVNL